MSGDKFFAYAFLITLPLTLLTNISDTNTATTLAVVFFIGYFISSVVVLWDKGRKAKGK